MKKLAILIVLLLFTVFSYGQKQITYKRIKTDSLLIFKLNPSTSDTVLCIYHDTVFYKIIKVDSVAYSDTSMWSFHSLISDTSNTLQGWDTTTIINYISAHGFDSTRCWKKLLTDSIESCNGHIFLKDTVSFGGVTFPISDGLPGQSLVTDGAGVVSWGTGFDSTHCYQKLLSDTLESCGDHIAINDTINSPYLASGSSDIVLVETDSLGNLDSIATIDITTDTLPQMQIDTLYMNGAYHVVGWVTLADDATFNLPVSSGSGWFKADSAGVQDEAIYLTNWNTDGTLILVQNSPNVAFSDTDGKLCFYDGGAYCVLKNRLGSSRKILLNLTWYE